MAENERECSFADFCKCMPFNIRKPKVNDWGTCLCSYCLNPEFKVETLNGLSLLLQVSLEDDISEDRLV